LRAGRPPSAISRKFVRWITGDCLPFWTRHGWDERNGGFHERFHPDRRPDDAAPRRLRVQWRQIYVLAHASLLGWNDGLKLALKGLEHVIQRGWGKDGAPGFVHLLAPDGSVLDAKRDTYDHAFAVLALSWLARASGDAQVRSLLEVVLQFIDSGLTDEKGYLIESIPPAMPRRQNPHMHMFEATLALAETIQHPEGMARAARLRRMLDRTFIEPESNLLVEYFSEDWQPLKPDGAAIVEPGHMAEWVWLIRKYERLSGTKSSPIGTHLLGSALRAVEPEHGFLLDETNTAGRIVSGSRRLWPQTEIIKAWLAQAESGADGADRAAEAMIEALLAIYLSGPFRGGWHDRYTAKGEVEPGFVPASTLYHIFLAAAECDRLLGS
jgi:mannose-6-phosphate isomerase